MRKKISDEAVNNGQKTGAKDAERGDEEKIPYPKSVFFIFGNEFCERFSFYGMKAILTIYLANELRYSENSATVTYHVFNLFCYFTPLFGAIIADSYWGKFKTITYISILYAFGNIIMAFGAVPIKGLPQQAFAILGLAVIAIGTGGIKPCVSAFGGDQFVLPEQERELQQFFSLFYFSINAGSLISTFITPMLRNDVHCLGNNSCYPLAFGVPAILMVVALVLFVLGKSMYTIREPEGNMVVKVSQCVGHALKQRVKGKNPKKEHWLDYAEDEFDKSLIGDIKAVLKVLTLYIPLPIFWTLFDQQGSRWTLLATRMDGRISSSFTLKPDQMQVINPLLILILIPLFDSIVYPVLYKMHLLKRPLQKMVLGMILAGAAFAISGFVELKLQETYPIPPKANDTRFVFMNTLNCDVQLSWNNGTYQGGPIDIKSLHKFEWKDAPAATPFQISARSAAKGCVSDRAVEIEGESQKAYSVLVLQDDFVLSKPQKYEKPPHGLPFVRITYKILEAKPKLNATVEFRGSKSKFSLQLDQSVLHGTTDYYKETIPDLYSIAVNDKELPETKFEFRQGGVYEVSLIEKPGDLWDVDSYVVTEPNNVHMLWLVPQYVVITTAEVLFSPTGYEFSFTQAPTSMKSLIQSGWLLSIAFGNLIVVIVAEAHIFDQQYLEFFFFAILIWVFSGIFSIMAWRYKYQDFSSPDDGRDKKKKKNDVYSSDGVENKAFEADSKF